MTNTIGIIGDLHLSDKPPAQCTAAYNDQIFMMLSEITSLMNRSVDAVVFAGDVFHLKAPHRTSHRTVQRMIDVIKSFRIPVFIVPGNHDLQNNRLESIYDTQPLGVLIRAGAQMLDGWALDFSLYGVPWQQDWQQPQEAFTAWRVSERNQSQSLLVTHAPLYPPGQELPWEYYPTKNVSCLMGNEGYCYYGHVHECHGSYHVDGVTYCNQGAISRGSLQEEDLTRRPAVTLWRSDRIGTAAFERLEIQSAPPPEEVFRIVEALEESDYRSRVDGFLEAVAHSTVSRTTIESILSHLKACGDLTSYEIDLAEEVLHGAQESGR
jgi:DNA repair exonuclease SbcCD nuclease subunit